MPTGNIEEIIPSNSERVFDIIHDYDRRLDWDTLLSEAFLEPEFAKPFKGAISVCRGRRILGGIAIRSVYVTYKRGRVAAVRMLNRPPFFESFAASIRHFELPNDQSRIVYKFNFTARPRFLRFILHPIMLGILQWETRKRLKALRDYCRKNHPAVDPTATH